MSIRKDFHGGRTYGPDDTGDGPGLGFKVALWLAWVKSRLRGLFGDGPPDSTAPVPRPQPFPSAEAQDR